MSKLFSPHKIKSIEFKNRIFVSPMCQYSSVDGVAQAWHMVHIGSRAVGGASLVIAEATAVSPEGRISYGDAGIWNDKQVEALKPITKFVHEQNSVAGIQLAHAGRKASTEVPWKNHGKGIAASAPNGWQTMGPSAVAFSPDYQTPKEMTSADLEKVIHDFEEATKRALAAGYKVIELHCAHGYLMHEFLSPLSNKRTDQYGGALENRMRFPLLITEKVRDVWPEELPLFVRISATDWTDGGWDVEQSIQFCRELQKVGVDFIDCSTGGNIPNAKIKTGPGYQVPFAVQIKKAIPTILIGAVGEITDAKQAEDILRDVDAVLLAREFLREPYWALSAAHELGDETRWPNQYERAKPK